MQRWDIVIITAPKHGVIMARRVTDPKEASLRRWHTFHPHPEKVTDSQFRERPFLDPRDLLQVRYEMVRRVEMDGRPVQETAQMFGVSRPTFYLAQRRWKRGGVVGLLPEKRGPRHGHKLTEEIMQALQEDVRNDPSLRPEDLARRVGEHFGVRVHPRSIVRALARGKKRQRLRRSGKTRRRA